MQRIRRVPVEQRMVRGAAVGGGLVMPLMVLLLAPVDAFGWAIPASAMIGSLFAVIATRRFRLEWLRGAQDPVLRAKMEHDSKTYKHIGAMILIGLFLTWSGASSVSGPAEGSLREKAWGTILLMTAGMWLSIGIHSLFSRLQQRR